MTWITNSRLGRKLLFGHMAHPLLGRGGSSNRLGANGCRKTGPVNNFLVVKRRQRLASRKRWLLADNIVKRTWTTRIFRPGKKGIKLDIETWKDTPRASYSRHVARTREVGGAVLLLMNWVFLFRYRSGVNSARRKWMCQVFPQTCLFFSSFLAKAKRNRLTLAHHIRALATNSALYTREIERGEGRSACKYPFFFVRVCLGDLHLLKGKIRCAPLEALKDVSRRLHSSPLSFPWRRGGNRSVFSLFWNCERHSTSGPRRKKPDSPVNVNQVKREQNLECSADRHRVWGNENNNNTLDD